MIQYAQFHPKKRLKAFGGMRTFHLDVSLHRHSLLELMSYQITDFPLNLDALPSDKSPVISVFSFVSSFDSFLHTQVFLSLSLSYLILHQSCARFQNRWEWEPSGQGWTGKSCGGTSGAARSTAGRRAPGSWPPQGPSQHQIRRSDRICPAAGLYWNNIQWMTEEAHTCPDLPMRSSL